MKLRNLALGSLLAAALVASCGGNETVASRSARALREAQQKGLPVGGDGHGHEHAAPAASQPASGMEQATDSAAQHAGHSTAPSQHDDHSPAHHGTSATSTAQHAGHSAAAAQHDGHSPARHGAPATSPSQHAGHSTPAQHDDHSPARHGATTTSAPQHAGHSTTAQHDDHSPARHGATTTSAAQHAGHSTAPAQHDGHSPAPHAAAATSPAQHTGHSTAHRAAATTPAADHAGHPAGHERAQTAPPAHHAHTAVAPGSSPDHAAHATQQPGTTPPMQHHHGAAAVPSVAGSVPQSSGAMLAASPATTLQPDALDAPAPIAVAEATKAANNIPDGDVRHIVPGTDQENPPTPQPAIWSAPPGTVTTGATDHTNHESGQP